ncbi:MAG: hypothetical protein QM774_04255 [Gordonia sp. (in: high G+C Gram-positive bacteria)]|uniref:hypothetical protein n=1 Tax=Gordonia sp. (in: high G+C Gram-positive bacteria) TaxID=84139 RepID=UPI0039E3D77E
MSSSSVEIYRLRIRLSDGRIEAEALDAIASAAEECGDLCLSYTSSADLHVPEVPAHRVDDLRARIGEHVDPERVDTVPSPVAEEKPVTDRPTRIGWFGGDDGLVELGTRTPGSMLSARQARFLAAIGVPLTFTARREILITGLGEGVAETVVRVLAPMGFVFDADAP